MTNFPIAIPSMPATRFPLGRVLMTANAAGRLDTIPVNEAIRRHACCDWGELCPEDAALNDQALVMGGRLLSAYGFGENRFWIITDEDFATTTILMPEDY
jgi:hypothetical protein